MVRLDLRLLSLEDMGMPRVCAEPSTREGLWHRSIAGIFASMKPENPVTCDYEIYLPAKNIFVTTWDVIFCEHVGRNEPERLLPPSMSLPESISSL